MIIAIGTFQVVMALKRCYWCKHTEWNIFLKELWENLKNKSEKAEARLNSCLYNTRFAKATGVLLVCNLNSDSWRDWNEAHKGNN